MVAQGAELSPHESTLLRVMQSVSWLVLHQHRDAPLLPPPSPAFKRQRGIGGRRPSPYEARAAFLMLFGETHHLNVRLPGSSSSSNNNMSVAVTIAGASGRALLVQRLGADAMAVEEENDEGDAARVGAEAVAQFGFVQDRHDRKAAQRALLAELERTQPGGMRIRLRKPPHGFQWASFLGGGAENAEVTVRIEEWRRGKGRRRAAPEAAGKEEEEEEEEQQQDEEEEEEGEEDGLHFYVEGREVEAFDARELLEPCNEATTVLVLEGLQLRLVREALYALSEDELVAVDDAMDLFRELQVGVLGSDDSKQGRAGEGGRARGGVRHYSHMRVCVRGWLILALSTLVMYCTIWSLSYSCGHTHNVKHNARHNVVIDNGGVIMIMYNVVIGNGGVSSEQRARA